MAHQQSTRAGRGLQPTASPPQFEYSEQWIIKSSTIVSPSCAATHLTKGVMSKGLSSSLTGAGGGTNDGTDSASLTLRRPARRPRTADFGVSKPVPLALPSSCRFIKWVLRYFWRDWNACMHGSDDHEVTTRPAVLEGMRVISLHVLCLFKFLFLNLNTS